MSTLQLIRQLRDIAALGDLSSMLRDAALALEEKPVKPASGVRQVKASGVEVYSTSSEDHRLRVFSAGEVVVEVSLTYRLAAQAVAALSKAVAEDGGK